MNLIKLQIVELIDKYHHMTSVAEILGIKQPTVTFHMKSLEEEMGVRLFESRSGKTFLTEAGQALLHYSVKINALTQEARRVVKEYDSLYRGTLHIGASYVPATYLLPAMLHTFSQEFPGIRMLLSVKPAPVIREMVIRHQLDLGIISSEPFVGSVLHAETLCEDDLVLICSPQHGLTQKESLHPEDIAQVPFALHGDESSTRRLTNHWLVQHDIRSSGAPWRWIPWKRSNSLCYLAVTSPSCRGWPFSGRNSRVLFRCFPFRGSRHHAIFIPFITRIATLLFRSIGSSKFYTKL